MSPIACIVGGSLGGLFAGHFLRLAGWQITIHERTEEPLSGRGAGIVTYPELATMVHTCIGRKAALGILCEKRIVQDKTESIIAEKIYPQVMASWEWLFNILFEALPPNAYHLGNNCIRAIDLGDSVELDFTSGEKIEADLAVFADGIYSEHRKLIDPYSKLEYAGYVAWRGIVEEKELSPSARAILRNHFAFALPHRQQLLTYPVARPQSEDRSINYVWYRPAPVKDVLKNWLLGKSGTQYEEGIPPHEIRDTVINAIRIDAERDMPKAFSELVNKTERPLMQPIYDLATSRMCKGRFLMIGDAAFSARPHVGMGVIKAAEDACLLGDRLANLTISIEDSLAEWETARRKVGEFLVDRGRMLGSYLAGEHAEDPPGIIEIMSNSALRVTDIPDYPMT
jgi:2-polyprenyl-6-methoxyphenol hydroxylase-like FAD-dependent oxidoreductase